MRNEFFFLASFRFSTLLQAFSLLDTRKKQCWNVYNPRSRNQLTVNESLHVLLGSYGDLKVSALNCVCFKLPRGKVPH